MKILIPLDETKKEVCVSFGRTPFFLVRDTETSATDIVVNPAADAESGAGLKAAQAVVDQGAQVLITVRCGENAAQVLKAAEITIYQAQGAGAEENLTAFGEGRLQELTRFHAGYHGLH